MVMTFSTTNFNQFDWLIAVSSYIVEIVSVKSGIVARSFKSALEM